MSVKMKVLYPKVKMDAQQRAYVVFYVNDKRYRIFNGNKINCELHPNAYPIDQRLEIAQLLAAEVYKFLQSDLTFAQLEKSKKIKPNMTDREYLEVALENKLKGNYSNNYTGMLRYVFKCLDKHLTGTVLTEKVIYSILNNYASEVSYNTLKRHLNVLINEARSLGMVANPMAAIKSKKTKAKLHKPYQNMVEVLDEIKHFNERLHLCCLLTYGCLLRPHREVRELTWGDFSEDLHCIYLSGNRNKSGKNRIVPVPRYIRQILVQGDRNNNIFTNTPKPLNKDYFKTLWSRFKKVSKLLEQDQTLYSFRHSGAIEIFKRTGSLTKLQKAMGHSSINVSLTYLRGLEVPELSEEDMPMV